MSLTPTEALREEIATRQAMLVVGSGLTIHATGRAKAASWLGLLEMGIDYCLDWTNPKPSKEWSEHLRAKLQSPSVENALAVATEIEKCLGAPGGENFRSFLEATVGKLKASRFEMLNGIKLLHEAGTLISTTNYDGLLEDLLKLDPVPWNNPQQSERVVRIKSSGILHLHGWWCAPDSIVLGVGSYDAIKHNDHAQTIQKLIAIGRTLIFVGCGDGLDDPNFGKLLEWMSDAIPPSGLYHFRLCRRSEELALRAKHAQHNRIAVVPYGDNFDDLGEFARQLVSSKKLTSEVARVTLPSVVVEPIQGSIRFEHDVIVDRGAVAGVLGGGTRISIEWHHEVQRELDRIKHWSENFQSNYAALFPTSNGGASLGRDPMWIRAELRRDWDVIRERLDVCPAIVQRSIDITGDADQQFRIASITNLMSFMALQMVRLIRRTEQYIFDQGPRHHECFPGISSVSQWLVDLVPDRSAIGAYVFKEDQFLRARVGRFEESYKTIIMPKYTAEHLARTQQVGGAHTYYEWVLPQWLLYSYDDLPSVDEWQVFVVSDGRFREFWAGMRTPPWYET